MEYIYVDTSALIALSDKNDKNHKRAVLYFKMNLIVLFSVCQSGKFSFGIIGYLSTKRKNRCKSVSKIEGSYTLYTHEVKTFIHHGKNTRLDRKDAPAEAE